MSAPDDSAGFVVRRLRSFRFAFAGARAVLATQPNAWIHAFATVLVMGAGFGLHVSRFEWALLVFAIGLVWTAEAFNTALEFLADEVTQERRERIKRAKDAAAFGVLCAALAAAIIGALVFLPYLLK